MMMRIWSFISRLIRIVIILAIVSAIAFAVFDYLTDKNRQVSRFDQLHYDVTLEPDGSATVVETRTYTFSRGRFTYGWFDLSADAFDIWVSEEGRPYTRLDVLPTRRQPDQFIVLPQVSAYRLEWYYEATGPQTRRFQFHYRIPDVAVTYDDCVVYFQKYLSESNTADIRRIRVTVRLPDGADAANTLIWGHGPAHGRIDFAADDRQTVEMQVDRIGQNQYVEARFLLPVDSIPQARRQAGPMYEQVLAEETAAAAQANRERNILLALTVLAVLAALVLLTLLIRFYRLHRASFLRLPAEPVAPYLRDVPTRAPLPIVARLFHFYRKKTTQAELISLTMLDLIGRGILLLEAADTGKKGEVWLSLQPNEDGQYAVQAHEAPVLDYLFRDVAAQGQGSRVSLDQLRRYSRASKNRSASASLLLSFESALDQIWLQTGYEDKSRTRTPAPLIGHRLACLAAGAAGYIGLFVMDAALYRLPGMILLGSGVILLVANWFKTHKRPFLSQSGENEQARWQALANFFRDFSAFDEKDLPEIGLWEDLLIYAAALSMADQVLAQLKVRYPDLEDWTWQHRNHYWLYGMGGYSQSGRHEAVGLATLQSSFNQIMQSAHSVVTSHASSQGGGGGFSGGGSSGGGGAGGSSGGGVG